MDAIILILLLQLKHYAVDFYFQTYEQTVRKGIYGDLVGITHSLEHSLGTAIAMIMFSMFFPMSVAIIIVTTILEGLLHYHIDWFKVNKGTKDVKSDLFWNQFGMDQLAHQLTYLLMAYILLVH